MRRLAAALLTSLFIPQALAGDSVQAPVAIRWWGQGMVSIETWWGLTVVIDPYSEDIGYELPDLSADLVLVTHEHADHNNVDAVKGEPHVARGLDDEGRVNTVYHRLARVSNNSRPTWEWNQQARARVPLPHEIHIRSIPSWHDDTQGSDRGANAMFSIMVDGVHILHAGDLGQSKLTDDQLQEIGNVDVLLLPVGGVYTIDGDQAWKIVNQVEPRIVVPIHYKTDKLNIPLEPVDKFATNVPNLWQISRLQHNTLAVSASPDKDPVVKGRTVILDYKPWQPTGELAALLGKMDAACRASQAVFAPLTAEQLNWRPPDGTHTPRWNAEHMMGRQLGFFSQIYAAIANQPSSVPPNIRVDEETIKEHYTIFTHIDLNPKQMPDDYAPAHPDWDGAEEARGMQRANAYVRRFAYLLDGLDLDAKAPGSFWTPRRLLKQMDRHFGEHTANVEKKFELDGWPEG